MEGEVLREFLVRLGFNVDKASSKFFDDKVGTATKNVLKLGAAAATVAAAVTYAVTKISEKLDELYYASARIGSTVGNIQAFGYAVSQMGGSAAGALQSLENMARFIRTSPGAIDLIKSLGVRTTDDNGKLRDTVDIMTDLGGALRKMPYYQANAYAGVLGIDEKTLMALREGTEEFADEYRQLMKRAGLDSQQAAKDASAFTKEVRGMNAAVGVLVQKFTSLLSARMAQSMRATREYFVSNFDRIAGAIEVVVDTFGRIVTAVQTLFGRAVDIVQGLVNWFLQLNPLMLDMIKVVAAIAAGWVALNTVISLSPIGMIVALGTALLALYDDYQTWREGGKSLIDWENWKDEVDIVVDLFTTLRDAVESLFGWLNRLGRLIADSGFGDAVGAVAARVFAFLGNKEAKAAVTRMNGGTVKPEDEGKRTAAPAEAGGAERTPIAKGSAGTPLKSSSSAAKAGPSLNTEGAMQFFQSAGWTKEQAAGIVANLKAESALKPDAIGDSGKAYGVAQWHPDRQANFKKVFGKDIRDSTLEEQLKFVHYELTQGAEKKAGDALRATKSADLAAEVVSTQYERPADREGEAQKRGEAAVTIAQTTNINVTGAGPGTAQEIAGLQKDVNQQMVRNTKGAVR